MVQLLLFIDVISTITPHQGTLEKLHIRANGILNKDSGKALADALKSNSVLKELDVSSNYDGSKRSNSKDGRGFASELAVGLGVNGALTSLNLASNYLGPKGAKHVAEAIKVNVSALRFD